MSRQLVGNWSEQTLRSPVGPGAKTVQIRLGKYAERVDAYAARSGRTVSATLRHLIRWGSQAEGDLAPVSCEGSEMRATVLSGNAIKQCANLQAYLGTKLPRGTVLRALVVESLIKAEEHELDESGAR